jgi:hypothetical protein
MATQTDKFEKATLISFYYVIKKGAPYAPVDRKTYEDINKDLNKYDADDLSKEMALEMLNEYPGMDYDKWYLGILRGAQSLNEKLGYKEGHKDKCWSYAHFGSKAALSPVKLIKTAGDDTDILDWVWNNFDKKMQDQFDGKKDSWNTADVYMVKTQKIDEIKRGMKKALCIGEHGNHLLQDIGWCLGVGEVNTYMSKLLQQQILLPLSLKQATGGVAVKIKPNNLSQDPDGVEGLQGDIETPLRDIMSIVREDNKWGKNVPAFGANSLTFTGSFQQGNVGVKYKYESKISSNTNHATEPRDMVMNNKSKYVQASARNGAIPAPRMVELVKEYTGDGLNDNIPLDRKLNSSEIKYWGNKLSRLTGGKGNNMDWGGRFTPFSIEGVVKSKQEFIEIAAILDGGKPFSGGKFTTPDGQSGNRPANFDGEFRSKLRLLRYIEMIQNASDNDRLGELLATMYFLSSKINFKQGQLSGPFWKVQ